MSDICRDCIQDCSVCAKEASCPVDVKHNGPGCEWECGRTREDCEEAAKDREADHRRAWAKDDLVRMGWDGHLR